ncbi:hypothetical protein WK78_28950 [Burkholderia cepacia]|uniref:hypothetical protein n=1 Tax=Burkholderia TaxID=32008 RepID=UPI0007534411|nr:MULTISPECIES: hypothetical protein [Burkholderia]KVV20316.1 hypothetical protein WK78_28950 [Burkholderia cepacia]UVE57643.1 hypothetical protein KU887_19865 [Burkholderia sp. EMB26]
MTEEQALRKGREAVEDARQRVGDNRNALIEELSRAAIDDPELATAFAIAGHLIIEAQQQTKQ